MSENEQINVLLTKEELNELKRLLTTVAVRKDMLHTAMELYLKLSKAEENE